MQAFPHEPSPYQLLHRFITTTVKLYSASPDQSEPEFTDTYMITSNLHFRVNHTANK